MALIGESVTPLILKKSAVNMSVAFIASYVAVFASAMVRVPASSVKVAEADRPKESEPVKVIAVARSQTTTASTKMQIALILEYFICSVVSCIAGAMPRNALIRGTRLSKL
jgi:hypothetical protein